MTWTLAQDRALGTACQMVSWVPWTARAFHPPDGLGASVAVPGGSSAAACPPLTGRFSDLGLTFLGRLAGWRAPVLVSLCGAVVGCAGRFWACGGWRCGGLWRSVQAWSGRGGEAGEGGFPPAFTGSGREAGRGPAGVHGLAGVPGGEDALVADGVQSGEPEREWWQAHEAAPHAEPPYLYQTSTFSMH